MNKNWKSPQNNSSQREVVVQHSFSGPLPPPEVLKRFDEVVPGSAERIIKMAEGQFTHRTELERKVIASDIARSKLGQILGFVIAIVGLICSVIISMYGNQIAGTILGVGTLASLVSVFMYGSRVRKEERERKAINE
ncbi:MAG: DUF2335 domain-containing protein [Patescibacteria group bacterium]